MDSLDDFLSSFRELLDQMEEAEEACARVKEFEPVLAGEYISERAAMHRLDYTEGKTEEELEQLSAEIRAYQV